MLCARIASARSFASDANCRTFHARRRHDLELRHDRPGGASHEIAFHTKRAQRLHELDAHRIERAVVHFGVARRGRGQQIRRWSLFFSFVVPRVSGCVNLGRDSLGVLGDEVGFAFFLTLLFSCRPQIVLVGGASAGAVEQREIERRHFFRRRLGRTASARVARRSISFSTRSPHAASKSSSPSASAAR